MQTRTLTRLTRRADSINIWWDTIWKVGTVVSSLWLLFGLILRAFAPIAEHGLAAVVLAGIAATLALLLLLSLAFLIFARAWRYFRPFASVPIAATAMPARLGDADLVVVSGLARGIDAAAHEAALPSGTVAIFAGGIDTVYPRENEDLFRRILDAGGSGISEMRLGWEPRARDFPRRNRIIAAMALATVVVEAAERSGSLITARLALEQNREVMAVPGSPLDPRAAGANNLIKQGARMVTEAADVIEAVRPMLAGSPDTPPLIASAPPPAEPVPEPDDSDRARILEALGPTPIEVDEIIRFTGLSARTVLVVLLELDVAGRIERHAGQRVSLR